ICTVPVLSGSDDSDGYPPVEKLSGTWERGAVRPVRGERTGDNGRDSFLVVTAAADSPAGLNCCRKGTNFRQISCKFYFFMLRYPMYGNRYMESSPCKYFTRRNAALLIE